MAYIGQGIKSGTFSVLDTSGNTYNGSNVTFSLGTQVGSPAQLLVSHDGVIQKPGTDYSLATGGTQITFSTAPASGASIFITEISGAVGGPINGDLDGAELVLDTDGDTSITADTDDQIDIKIAGADDFQFTANTFTAQSGSTIAAQALTATTVTASGILKTDDATEATSTTDGSLQTDGGLSVVKDAVFGDDVSLLSDAAVLNFGADKDVSVTHVADTGLKISSAQATDKELLTLESTQAGANGPFIKFNHNTASAADDDIAGALDFYNNDDGGNSTQVGKIEVKMTDASNGSENSIISFSNNVAGTVTESLRVHEDGTVQLQNGVGSGTTTCGLAIGAAQKDNKRLTVYGSHSTLSGIAEYQTSNGSGDAAMILFTDGNNHNCGEITLDAGGNTVAYSTSSDYRLKENASAISNGITRVKQLKPYRFNFITDPDKTLDGFFAHEAQAVVPEAVHGTKDATKTVNNVVVNADGTVEIWGVTETEWTAGKTSGKYANNSTWEASKSVIERQGIDQSKLVPLLTAALKESVAKIEALEARVTTLEG